MLFPNIKKWIFALALSAAPAVYAVPVLQLYVEGGTYDAVSETWVVSDNDFTVWVIGNTGQRGTITGAGGLGGVSLVVSSHSNLANLSITPTLASCCDVVDPSLASNPVATQSGTGQHSVLANHGIFNQPGITWQQFDLGVFSLTDSMIGDATQGAWPVDVDGNFHGQINAYHVTMLGDFDFLHFDGYGYTNDGRRYVFAPFSHDAEALPPPHIEVPVPATLALFSVGALFLVRRRK